MRRWAFALVIAGLGCSAVEYPEASWRDSDVQPVDPVRGFALRTDGGAAVIATVGEVDVVGGDVSLERFRDERAVRGRAFGRAVNVEASPGRVIGLADGKPLDLAVERSDGALVVQGVVRGEPARFRLDERAAEGRLGRCAYELARGEHAYEGRRSCGGRTEHVWLRVPANLARWSDAERAAVLALLLGVV
jgi:hypothetical protein